MGQCLSEEQVMDYVSGPSRELVRAGVEQHIVDCLDCSELVAAAATVLLPVEAADARLVSSSGPSVTKIGPYLLDAPLGHGGMGVVFLCRHERTHEPAAIKAARFKTVGASASIRREIQILSQLKHPGVVRLLDHGIDDGLPWYAMELIEGVTLDEYVKALPRVDREAAPSALLTTMRRLASTLGYLHAAGVAHRDLSPRNIVVGKGNTPVLLDFGFAVRTFDAVEHIELNAWRAGTVPYLAPELIRGDSSDSRPADLYAVGCILYEVLTGAPPFPGKSEEEILRSHLRTVPTPPSEKLLALDRELDELVLHLLAKSPADRVRYPEDIADKLGELGGLDWEGGATRVRTEYLSRPALVGRREVLAQMLEVAAGVRRGAGAKLLIRGPSGIGKSRLVSEAAVQVRGMGVTVICGACVSQADEYGGVGPAASSLLALRPLLQELAERGRVGGPAVAERLVGARASVLVAFEPEFGRIDGFEAHAQKRFLPPEAAQQRLLDALVDSTLALAKESPLLLMIDDLQWADDLTRRFVKRLTPALLSQSALGVIGTVRDDDNARHSVAFGQLDGHETRLGPLEGNEVCRVICEMLAAPVAPQSLATAILERAEGNPFFVAEYLRTALAEGLLWRDGLGGWQFPELGNARSADLLPLPRGVRGLVERRLSKLSGAARSLAEVAAALGRECDTRVLTSRAVTDDLSGEAVFHLASALEELVLRQVLERSGGEQYRFVHDQLREVVYSGVAAERRPRVHAAIAAALDQSRPVAALLSGELAELGHHYALAGNAERGVHYLSVAGERALLAGATREARALVGRALELHAARQGTPADLGKLFRLHGEAAFGLGDLDDARKNLIAGLGHIGVRIPETSAGWAGLLMTQASRQLVHRVGPKWLRAAAADRQSALLERASLAGLLAIVYYFTGEAVPLLATLLLGVNCAERALSTETLAISYARIGYIAGLTGPTRLARYYFERALRLGEQTEDIRSLALALYLQAFHHLGRGAWAATIENGEQAVRLLHQVGDHQEREVAETIVAHALYYSGHVEEAERRYEKILESARKRESAQHVGWGLFLKARSQLAQGKAEGAIELLTEARALLRPLPDRLSLSICEGLLAQALLATDRLREATEVCRALGGRTSGPVLALAPCVHAYEAMVGVAVAQWSRSTGREAKQWRTKALKACRDLGRFARMFPIGVPARLRSLAQCAELDQRPERARRLLAESRLSAQALGMSPVARA